MWWSKLRMRIQNRTHSNSTSSILACKCGKFITKLTVNDVKIYETIVCSRFHFSHKNIAIWYNEGATVVGKWRLILWVNKKWVCMCGWMSVGVSVCLRVWASVFIQWQREIRERSHEKLNFKNIAPLQLLEIAIKYEKKKHISYIYSVNSQKN